jgi:hypothetical protein
MGKVLDKNLSEILKRSAVEKLFAVECIGILLFMRK